MRIALINENSQAAKNAQIEAALDHTKYDITVIDLHHRDWHYTAPEDASGRSTRTIFRSRWKTSAKRSTTP